MSPADAVTIARALATIPIAVAIAADARALALGLFLVAAASDAVDGWLARRSGSLSAHGALLDPLADKVLVVGTLVALSVAGRGWPVTVVTILVAGRELAVALVRIRAFAHGLALRADRAAKMKTAAQLAGTLLIIDGTRPWAVLGTGLVGLAFLAALYTLPRYLRSARAAA